ncbi:/ trmB / tRNA (guanine-N(7)-)-methyltransferase /:546517 Reverse [Candidatus Hepatoplasma crinochetorum]|uniref:tRNA (guanine-N(7)-)-methyltransferase n=1 Tax=Candidatus Hepatoplasma crinochetorum TaxID=295596 RepID=A0A0G7ZND5_9MOLU|nr:/ trmB / tRNA (guanine-N(7)-)-methyltransferase /:546517 Reverse [Candidatus Hepatoplasma crinochetorum]
MGRVRIKTGAINYLKNSKYLLNTAKRYQDFVNNSKDIWLEIGNGKGKFISEIALENNFAKIIGIEKIATIQAKALKKIEKLELTNVRFILSDINNLKEWFQKSSIEKIFINFPDPWPKKKHHKRRLLTKELLLYYYQILKEEGKLIIKTDQKILFDFVLLNLSEKELKDKFFILKKISDLHQLTNEKIVKTEYEEKFLKLEKPVYYLEISKNIL